jgi:N-acetyl-anhydromuramyl-L-alanine amidase AmpD
MNLHKLIFTKNRCYKEGRKITPKGIMVHSTGANNPTLKRYVGPDDGLLGRNTYGNHWNRSFYPGKCCHAFIGKLADGTVATYQVLPWDHRGWHAGADANNTHISFEICEDNLLDGEYFSKVYQEAIDLCVYLCKMYGLTEKDIIDHREGAAQGIASNHGDIAHWWPKHGKSMDTFRAAVKLRLEDQEPDETKESIPVTAKKGDFTMEMRVLKNGCKGDDVRALQILLIGNGYTCGGWGADGNFGAATETAVRNYQKAKRLQVDGKSGPETMRSLLGVS